MAALRQRQLHWAIVSRPIDMKRTETVLALAVLAVLLIPVALMGLWVYMSATATQLHPNPQDAPALTQAAPAPQWTSEVDEGRQIVRAALSEQNLPGLSVAVGVDGEIRWAEGFGWADLASRVPVSPDTRFRIGTLSTALTSAAVGSLLEDGRLELDAVIQTYVPAFPEKPWPVTLRQLMGHTAGVRNDGGDEGPLYSMRCERPLEGLAPFKDRDLLYEPGTRYQYSSYGWIVVSAAVEAAAGEPFLAFMQKRIFEPLGMRDTMADSPSESMPNRATPYFPRFAAEPRYGLHLMRPINYSCYAGSSVFLSTASDLVRFGMAVNGGTLLRPATVEALQTPQRLASGEETGYGLGWDLETVTLADEQTRWVGHEGTSLGGMVATLMTFPEHGVVVALISNISYADTESVALNIARAFAAQRKGARRHALTAIGAS
jgi:CubicO group peptidase (beta-lactamase class C family)